jgi:hypothetical protein
VEAIRWPNLYAESGWRPRQVRRQIAVKINVSSFFARRMSALGHKRTLPHVLSMAALPPKAEIRRRGDDVRFRCCVRFGS